MPPQTSRAWMAALAGLALSAPFSSLVLVRLLAREPTFGRLDPWIASLSGRQASRVVLFLGLLQAAGTWIALRPVRMAAR